MAAKLHDFFTRFRRGAYVPLSTDGGTDEDGFAYRANNPMAEKHVTTRSSLRALLKSVFQIFLVFILMVGSYIFGRYTSDQQSPSTSFVPTSTLLFQIKHNSFY